MGAWDALLMLHHLAVYHLAVQIRIRKYGFASLRVVFIIRLLVYSAVLSCFLKKFGNQMPKAFEHVFVYIFSLPFSNFLLFFFNSKFDVEVLVVQFVFKSQEEELLLILIEIPNIFWEL